MNTYYYVLFLMICDPFNLAGKVYNLNQHDQLKSHFEWYTIKPV